MYPQSKSNSISINIHVNLPKNVTAITSSRSSYVLTWLYFSTTPTTVTTFPVGKPGHVHRHPNENWVLVVPLPWVTSSSTNRIDMMVGNGFWFFLFFPVCQYSNINRNFQTIWTAHGQESKWNLNIFPHSIHSFFLIYIFALAPIIVGGTGVQAYSDDNSKTHSCAKSDGGEITPIIRGVNRKRNKPKRKKKL